MARIPLVSAENLTPEQRIVYDRIVSGPRKAMVGPLPAALHNPELAEHWQQLGALLRYKTSLTQRLKEIAILVTARRWNAELEWQIHEDAARSAGVPIELIEAIRTASPATFSADADRTVYEFVRELQETGRVSEDTYRDAHVRFGTAGVVELTALVGYYTMVAMTLNAHEITLPAATAACELPSLGDRLSVLPAAHVSSTRTPRRAADRAGRL
jgi:4-carboxymuconolactone decarboxylase